MSGFFTRLKASLSPPQAFSQTLKGFAGLLKTKGKLSPEQTQMLEEILIGADLGVAQARALSMALAQEAPFESEADLRTALAISIARILAPLAQPLTIDTKETPFIILLAGVNGTGKTTSIGKLAHFYKAQGKRVLLAACDTYRAAASEQLAIWATRIGVDIIQGAAESDSAALAYQAIEMAQAQGHNIVLIDTAGRLQNNQDLMAELSKLRRVIKKHDDTAPHASLLVIDATTGQNALTQTRAFIEAASINGLIITKLDSTARGGMLVPIAQECALPIHFIGMGESAEDLHPFNASDFAAALTDSDPALIQKEISKA